MVDVGSSVWVRVDGREAWLPGQIAEVCECPRFTPPRIWLIAARISIPVLHLLHFMHWSNASYHLAVVFYHDMRCVTPDAQPTSAFFFRLKPFACPSCSVMRRDG